MIPRMRNLKTASEESGPGRISGHECGMKFFQMLGNDSADAELKNSI